MLLCCRLEYAIKLFLVGLVGWSDQVITVIKCLKGHKYLGTLLKGFL